MFSAGAEVKRTPNGLATALYDVLRRRGGETNRREAVAGGTTCSPQVRR